MDMNGETKSTQDTFLQRETARKWAESAHIVIPARAELFAEFSKQINRRYSEAMTILELGSGPGLLAEHVFSHCKVKHYTLLDFSEAMKQIAFERLIAYQNSATFVQADLHDHAWADQFNMLDVVLTLQTVHELMDKRKAKPLFRQVFSTLRDGGYFYYCDLYYDTNYLGNDPALYLTQAKQKAALEHAGFNEVELLLSIQGMSMYQARKNP